MLRGLLAGGLSGLLVGGAALTVVSALTELPAGNTPPDSPQVAAPDETAPAEITSSVPDTVADDSTGDAMAGAVPRVQAPNIELATPVADTAPAAVPLAGEADELAVAPIGDGTPAIDVETVDPVLPNPQSVAPQIPVAEQDITISTEPSGVPQPSLEQTSNAGDALNTDADPVTPVDPAPQAQGEADGGLVAPEIETTAPAVVSIVPEDTADLPGGETGITVRRPADDTPQNDDTADQSGPAIDLDAPAIEKYAAKFENPENKPMVSVVLVDDGSLNEAVGAVASLNLPMTVVLDPDMADVTARMADYRAAGIEVAVRAVLPAGATPADVETAFEASFAKLPDTVLMIDDGVAGLQNNRAVTEFAMGSLAAGGRGFLTISSGLNTALRLAEQNNVPAAVVYRDLDGDGQDARVIRRFLDQAAFRARQDGVVFLLGRVRPDTISALNLWGTANRASQVVFAPASAALTATDQ